MALVHSHSFYHAALLSSIMTRIGKPPGVCAQEDLASRSQWTYGNLEDPRSDLYTPYDCYGGIPPSTSTDPVTPTADPGRGTAQVTPVGAATAYTSAVEHGGAFSRVRPPSTRL